MAIPISSKIIDYNVKSSKPIEIFTAVPIEREEILTSTTYKIKDTNGTGFYITISDVIVNGIIHPYEVFINSKDVEHYAYLTAITRLISAFFRTGHDYAFIANELQQIVDPKNGNYWKKGAFFTSFISEIGNVLEKHFLKIENENRK